eukprot:tig00020510_g9847.t1
MLLAERSSTLLQQLLSRHIVVVRAKHAQFSAQPPAQRGTSPYAPERGPAPRPLWLRSKPRTEFNSWSPATTNVQRAAASRRRKRASDLAAVPVATQALHGGRGREPLAYAGLLLLLLRRLNALFRGEIFRAEHAGCIILCGEKALQFLLGQAPVRWTGLIMNICIKGTTTSGRAEAWKAFRARRDWVSVPKDDRLQIPGGQAPDYSFVLELLTITEKDAVKCGLKGPRATSDLAGRLEWSAQEAVRRCLAEDGAASEDVQRILLNSLTLEKNVEQLTSKDPPPRQRGIISVLACVCLAERLPSAAFPRCANAGIGSGVGTSAWDAAWDAISADLGRVAPPAIPAPADLGVPSPTQAYAPAPRSPS